MKKCRLLGWWAGETKGYRLEDCETGKLITSRDVRFVEDDSPSDTSVVDGRGEAPSGDELDRLTPNLSSTAPSSQSQPAVVPPALSIPSKPQPAEIPLPPSSMITAAASEKSWSLKWENLPP